MLVLLGALKQEIAGLKSRAVIEETLTGPDCLIYKGKYKGKDILIGQTGIGKERAEKAAGYILERYPAAALISLGFAGALVENLKIGNIVLYNILLCGDYQMKPDQDLQTIFHSDNRLIAKALEGKNTEADGLHKVNNITTVMPVVNSKEKASLAESYDAQAVDMESYWIARIASKRGVPFLGIRAVSDTVRDTLPPFDRFINSGKLQWKRAVYYFLTHPSQMINLFHLYKNSRKAERNLTVFIDSFITRYEVN